MAEGNIAGQWSISALQNAEEIIVALLETAPNDQAQTILTGLKDEKLLFPFFKNVDGSNFEKLISKLTEWIFQNNPPQKPYDLFAMADKSKKYFIRYNDNLLGRSNSEDALSDGNLHFESVKNWYNTSDFSDSYKFTASPYEYIKVRFETNVQIGSSGFVAGKDYMLPALYVYLLFTNDTKQKWITTGKITVDIAITLLGGAEIVAAYRASSVGGFVLGAIDIGLGVGDIVLNQAYHNEIIAAYPESGEAFCSSWQTISMCYGIGRLGIEGLLADVNIARKFSRTNKNNPDLTPETRQFLNNVDEKLNGPDFSRFATDVDNILAGIRAKFIRCGCANELDDFLILKIKDKLTDAEIAKLDLDLVGNQTLKIALNNDQELVDVWKNCSNKVSSSRSNSLFLKKLKEFRNDQALIQHIEGIATNKNAVGGHFTDVVSSKVLIGDISSPLPISSLSKNSNGVSQVLPPNKVFIKREILMSGGISHSPPQFTWKEKRLDVEGHTFFPETMSRDEILEQCASAFTNPNKITWGNKDNAFEAVSESGLTIRWYRNLTNDSPTSFFPKF